MTARTVRYTVGNEHNPGDPFGRSELVIRPDGSARVDHHFAHGGGVGAWTGRVDAAALDALWAALATAGFPAEPGGNFVAGATIRRLTVEVDGVPQRAMIDWHRAPKLPGYAEAFDVLDSVIRQLSGDRVQYPSKQAPIVSGVTAVGS